MSEEISSSEETFTCEKCGHFVTRITAPQGYDSAVCFMCNWLDNHPDLSEAQRQILREVLRNEADLYPVHQSVIASTD
jgi:hypothetical protein